MAELSVVIVATDNEQRAVLQVLVDGTSVARTVHSCANFHVDASDPVIRRVRAANPDVTLFDIPTDNPQPALRTIELLHQELTDRAIFAIGTLNHAQIIVSAMRAGAREFIERPTNTTDLLEAFVRLTAAQRRVRQEGPRGKVFSVINAKGGNGATTVAVNLGLALQAAHGQTALVDLAPLGHAALHMNLKPVFNVADATRNLHRMDSSLLESFMTRHSGGLQLLAGITIPAAIDPSTAEFVRLFDMLVSHYRYVVVDASSRFDAASRLIAYLSETVLLVACTEVASLWSAARVQQYLGESGCRVRVRLVLNRFRKVPGFSESDAEEAVGA
jgi:pilus assembly protein CpaE